MIGRPRTSMPPGASWAGLSLFPLIGQLYPLCLLHLCPRTTFQILHTSCGPLPRSIFTPCSRTVPAPLLANTSVSPELQDLLGRPTLTALPGRSPCQLLLEHRASPLPVPSGHRASPLLVLPASARTRVCICVYLVKVPVFPETAGSLGRNLCLYSQSFPQCFMHAWHFVGTQQRFAG